MKRCAGFFLIRRGPSTMVYFLCQRFRLYGRFRERVGGVCTVATTTALPAPQTTATPPLPVAVTPLIWDLGLI